MREMKNYIIKGKHGYLADVVEVTEETVRDGIRKCSHYPQWTFLRKDAWILPHRSYAEHLKKLYQIEGEEVTA